ncbi:MAG: isoleucine--tRNA ligase [Candidatus Azobacteroides pseudotrichonymphae]|jgi:isoleucyl-tRNA synthetase|nr:MAG: isoleucine--tRNA ligase [Candidatus Azobacteroides pseudotrichonymphae]
MNNKNQKFPEYKELNLAKINQEMLQYWETYDTFHRSIKIRKGGPSFVFYEGPPSANGIPGIHHVMARSIKDVFCRYKTMKGFQVKRRAGWDTHGLPVELGVEKALNITKEDIEKKIPIEEYNTACRKTVMKHTKEWEDLTRKMGYWIDMNNPYITYDNQYIETLWWLLKELYKKGLLYKGYTIQPYSPAAGTGLSTHELNQPGCYRDIKDTTCIAQFKIINPLAEMSAFGDAFFLAWTTTPWTLPSNTALCIGINIEYIAVQSYNPYTGLPLTAVIAKDLLFTHFDNKALNIPLEAYRYGDKLIPFKITGSWKGSELVGMKYEQLIPWISPEKKAFRIIAGDFVATDSGTGIVHIAPTFGTDDYKVAKANDIPLLMVMDKNGIYRPMVDSTGRFFRLEDLDKDFIEKKINISLYSEFAGRFVKNAYDDNLINSDTNLDIDICVMLKQQNRAFKIEKHIHSYPYCWRTDKPVLYYPLDSWFIRTTAVKDRMIELNNTINWKPQSIGQGRFSKWLENLQDWNLSRSRYWGTPLPIWCTEDGTEEKCIGSIKELMEEIQKAIEAGLMAENSYQNFKYIDLHRPYVDKIVLISESGKPMRRETDLIDVWFDSGAMPYAQLHYPFDNTELIDNGFFFPADFISEGTDQTRGWFFTLHAISVMVKDSVAFRNVISSGLVLDKNGNKMSKRLGNTIDPFEIIATYGSDPLRWYMITNSLPWDNLKFNTKGIEEVRRKFFDTLHNTYSFFALYANVDNFNYWKSEIPLEKRPEIDRWILSLLNSLIKEVDEQLSTYEPTHAARSIKNFVNDNLSNWYVRLNRKRFWKSGKLDTDKLSAYQTLYICLKTISQLISPIAPFYADKLYIDLVQKTQISVHLSDFPVANEVLIDKFLEEKMQIAQDISSMVLALRRKVNIKVRQPLSSIIVAVLNSRQKESVEAVQTLILNETNVEEIRYVGSTEGILIKKIKLDFRRIGPRYGKIAKDLKKSISNISQESISQLEQIGKISVQVSGQPIEISLEDVKIVSEDIPGWLVANNGKWTVALDITITDKLKKVGIARELVNRIQKIRKTNGYKITDRINLTIQSDRRTNEAIKENKQYIATQTLANSIIISDNLIKKIKLDLGDINLLVDITKDSE